MGTGSFPGVKCGRGVLLTTHPLLVPWSWKSRAIPLPPPPLGHTGPVTGSLYLYNFNYSTHYIFVYLLDNKVFNCHWCTVQTWRWMRKTLLILVNNHRISKNFITRRNTIIFFGQSISYFKIICQYEFYFRQEASDDRHKVSIFHRAYF